MKVRIIKEACHIWRDIANRISDDTHQISVLEEKHRSDPKECLRQVFTHNFIDNKPLNYSQDWNGLIELLDDVELEKLAKEVENARKSLTHT